MKKTVPEKRPTRKSLSGLRLALLAIAMAGSFPVFSAMLPKPAAKDLLPHGDTILVSKSQTSKRYKIKLYPNATHEVLFFSAIGEDGRNYQLYLFDMDSKLVKQVSIRNRETTVLTDISKGNYLFEIFSDDEQIENGQVTVK
jgi:hypothetical protein